MTFENLFQIDGFHLIFRDMAKKFCFSLKLFAVLLSFPEINKSTKDSNEYD